MLELKNQYKEMSCRDMKKGDVGVITGATSSSEVGKVVIRGFSCFTDLSTGETYTIDRNGPNQSWTVELLEPGTELVIK